MEIQKKFLISVLPRRHRSEFTCFSIAEKFLHQVSRKVVIKMCLMPKLPPFPLQRGNFSLTILLVFIREISTFYILDVMSNGICHFTV